MTKKALAVYENYTEKLYVYTNKKTTDEKLSQDTAAMLLSQYRI